MTLVQEMERLSSARAVGVLTDPSPQPLRSVFNAIKLGLREVKSLIQVFSATD